MRLRTARDIGALVRDARRRRGLTQEQLAARAGVTRRWLSGLESGKPGVELSLVLATFDALALELHAEDSPKDVGGVIDLDEMLAGLDERDS